MKSYLIFFVLTVSMFFTHQLLAIEPAFKQIDRSTIAFNEKLVKIDVTSKTTFDIMEVNGSAKSFRCECPEKNKACSVSTTKGKVSCGGSRCCGMTVKAEYSDQPEVRGGICP